MERYQYYEDIIGLIELIRDAVRLGNASEEQEGMLIRMISATLPHLERHLRYAILDGDLGRTDEIIGVALDHARMLHYTSQQTIPQASRPIFLSSRPFNEVLLSMLLPPEDANGLLGDLEERHRGTKFRAYWSDFLLAAFTLFCAKVSKSLRFERVFKGSR